MMYSMSQLLINTTHCLKRNTMTDFQKDILVGLLFVTGLFGFISGAFIVSAVVFAASAMFSNIHLTSRMQS